MSEIIGGPADNDAHGQLAADGGGGQAARDILMQSAAPAKEHAGHCHGENQTVTAGGGAGQRSRATQAGDARPATDTDSRGQTCSDAHAAVATAGGDGHPPIDYQNADAIPANNSGGQTASDNQTVRAPNGEAGDQSMIDIQVVHVSAFADRLDALIEFDHKYGYWVETTTRHINRLKGMGRRLYAGDNPDASLKDIKAAGTALFKEIDKSTRLKKPPPLSVMAETLQMLEIDTIEAFEFSRARRTFYEKRIEEIAALAPVAEWWCGIKGCNLLGIGRILAALGPGDPANGKPSLSNYSTVSKVRRRLGYACNDDGTRQRRVRGAKGEEQGFNPHRCAVVYGFMDSMFKHQGMSEKGTATEYRLVYEKRRAKKEAETDWSKGHLNNDALRILTKRLLRDLWRAWRDRSATSTLETSMSMPSDPALLMAAE